MEKAMGETMEVRSEEGERNTEDENCQRSIAEMKKIAILFFILVGAAFAQTPKVVSDNSNGQVWQIPFASTDNTISLSIRNSSSIGAKSVSVTFNKLPPWLKFKSITVTIENIPADSTGDAEFIFDVDQKAPVGNDTTLTATITNADGQVWTKDIKISIEAPTDYKPYDNFPNPFNPLNEDCIPASKCIACETRHLRHCRSRSGTGCRCRLSGGLHRADMEWYKQPWNHGVIGSLLLQNQRETFG